MYFPIIRGKQYDLLGVKELCQDGLLEQDIIPIIEPVVIIPTLCDTLELFIERKRQIGLVINPTVGTYYEEIEEKTENYKKYYDRIENCMESKYILDVYIMSETYEEDLETIKENYDLDKLIILCKDSILLENKYMINFIKENKIKYLLVPESVRLKRIFSDSKLVVTKDSFKKRTPNKEYLNYEDEYFSDYVYIYQNERYFGFSDYTVIGEEYESGGFSPYAVSLHITYEDNNMDTGLKDIRIKHFTSDSNDTNKFVQAKYGEASQKLFNWFKENEDNLLVTDGLKELIEIHEEGKFKGLGYPKKLSIKHHIELMGKIDNN